MDFELTRGRLEIKRGRQRVLYRERVSELKELLLEHEASESWDPRELVNKSRPLGFIDINFPEEYGRQVLREHPKYHSG